MAVYWRNMARHSFFFGPGNSCTWLNRLRLIWYYRRASRLSTSLTWLPRSSPHSSVFFLGSSPQFGLRMSRSRVSNRASRLSTSLTWLPRSSPHSSVFFLGSNPQFDPVVDPDQAIIFVVNLFDSTWLNQINLGGVATTLMINLRQCWGT